MPLKKYKKPLSTPSGKSDTFAILKSQSGLYVCAGIMSVIGILMKYTKIRNAQFAQEQMSLQDLIVQGFHGMFGSDFGTIIEANAETD